MNIRILTHVGYAGLLLRYLGILPNLDVHIYIYMDTHIYIYVYIYIYIP